MPTIQGRLKKMATQASPDAQQRTQVEYHLALGNNDPVVMNELLGHSFNLTFQSQINCIACGRKTNKSFGQGHCYPCFKSLPQCDQCIMSPEKCHHHLGTCRDPQWGESFCMTGHYVYLANSSGIKVGITRGNQIPTRWCDQGAVQGLAIFRVKSRFVAGIIETLFKQVLADKTNWRAMLKGQAPEVDLVTERDRLLEQFSDELTAIEREHGPGSVQPLLGQPVWQFEYPILEYPTKISSLNFDKTPEVGGKLNGIKAQYLIFDCGVINLRKFTAYQVLFEY